MGKEKGGFLTPKAIANRIKAKGLQKLRWYCQMCQKQCRDENGFKCHMMSESHQRQLLLFAENPDEYIDTFSKDFEDEYLELLRRRFGTKRVHCNIVYQEYISERNHVHMNSTQWETLTDFVKWLGREGKCNVDYTEKGWFIQYIDRDPETIRKQESVKAKEKMDMDDSEREAKLIQQQIERGAMSEKNVTETEFTELMRENEEEKVTFNLGASAKKDDSTTCQSKVLENPLIAASKKTEELSAASSSTSSSKSSKDFKKPKAGDKRKSALDEIMEFEEKKKEKVNRKDYWLHPGIVVKVISKKLGDKYYKQKGCVKIRKSLVLAWDSLGSTQHNHPEGWKRTSTTEPHIGFFFLQNTTEKLKRIYVVCLGKNTRDVQDLYGGIVKMLDSGDKLKVDQTHLETVIPAIGKSVMLVNGAYRGESSILESINEKKFSCTVSLNSGSYKGRVLDNIPYEDICKIYQPS